MLKPDLAVYRIEAGKGEEFKLSKQQTDEFNLGVPNQFLLGPEHHRFQPAPLIPSGQLGIYSADLAARYGLVNRVYGSKQELASAIGSAPGPHAPARAAQGGRH